MTINPNIMNNLNGNVKFIKLCKNKIVPRIELKGNTTLKGAFLKLILGLFTITVDNSENKRVTPIISAKESSNLNVIR